MSTNAQTSSPTAAADRVTVVLQLLRAVGHLLAVVAVTVWGFLEWPLPFPGMLAGIGFLVLSVLVWALFLSPKPVLRADRFGQSFIELLLAAAAVGAMLDFGFFWVWPALYGVIAAVLGYIVPARIGDRG